MNVVAPSLTGRSVLVTGATGFLGSAFVRRAVRDGARVVVLSRQTSDPWRLREVHGEYARVDAPLETLASLRLAECEGATMVHFAAAGVQQTVDDFTDLVTTNVLGTSNALQFALQHVVARFVMMGTSGEYGAGVHLREDAPLRPTSEYGAARAGATMLAKAFASRRGLDVTTVRPFAVFGPYEAPYRLLPYAITQALRGHSIRISSGHQTRDYVHVDDVVEGIVRACLVPEASASTFNLCTGIETSVLDAVATVRRLSNANVPIETGVVTPLAGDMLRTTGDPARARELLLWTPMASLAARLEQTINWFETSGLSLPQYADAHAHASAAAPMRR